MLTQDYAELVLHPTDKDPSAGAPGRGYYPISLREKYRCGFHLSWVGEAGGDCYITNEQLSIELQTQDTRSVTERRCIHAGLETRMTAALESGATRCRIMRSET